MLFKAVFKRGFAEPKGFQARDPSKIPQEPLKERAPLYFLSHQLMSTQSTQILAEARSYCSRQRRLSQNISNNQI